MARILLIHNVDLHLARPLLRSLHHNAVIRISVQIIPHLLAPVECSSESAQIRIFGFGPLPNSFVPCAPCPKTSGDKRAETATSGVESISASAKNSFNVPASAPDLCSSAHLVDFLQSFVQIVKSITHVPPTCPLGRIRLMNVFLHRQNRSMGAMVVVLHEHAAQPWAV